MHLGHCHRADGRWRLYAFADPADPGDPTSRLRALCAYLAGSLVPRYTPAGADPDAVFDVRAILQQRHRDVRLDDLPPLLLPRKGRYGLIDYEKAFAPDWTTGADDIFELRGIHREEGALVIVRPDQYVAHVLPLDAHTELAAYFAPLLLGA
jgi:phenol 2-monooxygenase